MCAGRESNPGLVRGRDVYYHCTTSAEFRPNRETLTPICRLSAFGIHEIRVARALCPDPASPQIGGK